MTADGTAGQLPRNLGVAGIVLMVVAAAAPLGAVGAALPLVFALSGTSAAPLYFALVGLLLVIFAVGFTRLSAETNTSGALYTYVRVGLGPILGFGTAALAAIVYMAGVVSVITFSGYLGVTLLATYTGASLPWWVASFVVVAFLGILGYRNIDLSAKVLGVILVVEALIVVLLDVLIFGSGGRAGVSWQPFDPSMLTQGAIGLGLLFTITSFAGFEAATIFRREAKDPRRTIPLATYTAIIGTCLFYILAGWALAVGMGVDEIAAEAGADPAGVVATIVQEYGGTVMADVFQILLLTSLCAAGLTFHNVITRYMLTLGAEGVLPRSLGVVHSVHRAPSRASLILSAIFALAVAAFAVAGVDPVGDAYVWLSGIFTLGIVVMLFLVALAVCVYFFRTNSKGWWSARVAPVLALVGLGTMVVLAVRNYSAVMNGSQSAAYGVELFLVAIFVAGCVRGALKVRSR